MMHWNLGILAAILALAACNRPGGGDDSPGGPYPPITVVDAFNVNEDVVLKVSAGSGVLANDTELQGNPMTAAVVTPPTQGLLTFQPDGSFVYTPTPDYSGSDSFSYQATGTQLVSSTTTVSITIQATNDPPTAVADAYVASEDVTLDVPVPGLLANDTDNEGDPLTSLLVTGPSHGTLNLNANGSFNYTSHLNYNGPDSFSYKARDAALDSAPVTVSITVAAVNDTPMATDQVYTTDAAGNLTVADPGVLGSAVDLDADPMTAGVVSPPSHGTLVLAADGSFTYTAGGSFSGIDSFTWQADDGSLLSNVATVQLWCYTGDAGPVYGGDNGLDPSRILKFPPAGGGAPVTLWSPPEGYGFVEGFTIGRSSNHAYVMTLTASGSATGIFKVDLSDGSSSLLSTFDSSVILNPNGLDTDPLDRLYTAGADRKVLRIDSLTGALTPLGTVAMTDGLIPGAVDLAVGPDDTVYVCPCNANVGATWIYAFNPVTGLTKPWANVPAGANIPGDTFVFVSGLAMNDDGELFVGSMESNRIFKYRDTSGDGDALDAGEEVEWAVLPYAADADAPPLLGIGLAGGGVVVNAQIGGNLGAVGVYRLVDTSGNGDAKDAGETVHYNATCVDNGGDYGCVAGKR